MALQLHRRRRDTTRGPSAAFRAMKHETAAGGAGRGADRRRRDAAPISAPPAALHCTSKTSGAHSVREFAHKPPNKQFTIIKSNNILVFLSAN